MRRPRVAALLALQILAAGIAAAQQRPVFRSRVDVVTVDVAVRSGTVPVGGLTGADFEVLDNGVRQQVQIAERSTLPVDLTMVLDVSGSMRSLIGPMTRYAQSVLALLQPDDRLRWITVGTYVTQRFGFADPSSPIEIADVNPTEMTSLYDGVATAMMRLRQTDRRHLVVVVSDGIDTTSTLHPRDIQAIVRRTDSVLYAVVPEHTGTGRFPDPFARADTRLHWSAPTYRGHPLGSPDYMVLAGWARETGGSFERIYATPGGLTPAVKNVLDQFRHSYVLRYEATGVPREGWHELAVRLPAHPGVQVRARRGYWGGQ